LLLLDISWTRKIRIKIWCDLIKKIVNNFTCWF